jgi:hypothetical protein
MAAIARRQIICCVCALGAVLATTPRAAATTYPPPPIPRELRRLMQALHIWEAGFRSTLLSETGGPDARSWRVEILRMLELDALRKQYDDAKPWNSTTNQKVLAQRPQVFEPGVLPAEAYACLGLPAPRETTRFVGIVDPRTAWQPGRGLDLIRIPDGNQVTIVLIEAPELDIPWIEPRDATLSEAVALLGSPMHRYSDHYFYVQEYISETRYVGFADGRVEQVPLLNPQAAMAYLTSDGHDTHLITAAYNGPWRPAAANYVVRHVKWGRVLLAAIAALVSVISIRILRSRRRSQRPIHLSTEGNMGASLIESS